MESRRERYLDLFVAEAREHLDAATRLVADLGREGRAEPRIREIFRHFHSLKGMAVSMDLGPMSRLAHDGESLLAALHDGRVGVDAVRREVLGEVVDCLQRMVDRAARGLDAEDPFVAILAERLREATEAEGAPSGGRRTRLRLAFVLGPDRPLPAARVAVLLGRLREAGTVLAADPAPAALRDAAFEGRLRVLLETDLAADRLARLLGRLDGVEAFTVLPAEEEALPAPAGASPRRVAVPADALDRLVEEAAELARRSPKEIAPAVKRLLRGVDALRRGPLDEIADRLAVAAHRAAARLGKRVRVEVLPCRGRLPRTLLEALVTPLGHVVRNAVDHGIEPPEERRTRGKAEEGRLTVSATRRGRNWVIRVADDGRGMDPSALKRAAVARGLLAASEAARLTDEAAVRLAALPGLTTRGSDGPVSGRGIGLDVVADAAARLGGRLTIRSGKGSGTTIEIEAPDASLRRRASRGGGGCALSEGRRAPVRRPSRRGTR